MDRAVVIGAGLGGLGAGIHLASRGWDVTLLERNSLPGGRMNRIESEGFRFDTGPTLLMMPEVLENLFAGCGRDLRDYLTLRRLDPAYEVRFPDGARVRVGDRESTREDISALNAGDGARFPSLLSDMERKYRNARSRFIERPFNHLGDLLAPRTLLGLARALPMESVWDYVSRWCVDPRVRQALTFQTLYLGTSPHTCPAIYGFLPFIELEFGVWYPEGGMYAVTEALTRLFLELGGRLQCGVDVEEIAVERQAAKGVRTRDGRLYEADAVVSNCDVQTTYSQLVPARYRRRHTDERLWSQQSGCSGYLLHLGVRRIPPGWGHHTVLLPDDYGGVMTDLFERRTLPRNPALYTCVPTCSDPTLAPEGHHVVYVLAPAPHLDSCVDWEREAPLMRRRCLAALERAGWEGLERDIVVERQWTPHDFRSRFGLFRGSAFGLAHTFFQSAYFRPHNRSEDIERLYLVGASTHPGGGVPIVLTSSRLVAEAVCRDAERRPDRTVMPASVAARAGAGGSRAWAAEEQP